MELTLPSVTELGGFIQYSLQYFPQWSLNLWVLPMMVILETWPRFWNHQLQFRGKNEPETNRQKVVLGYLISIPVYGNLVNGLYRFE